MRQLVVQLDKMEKAGELERRPVAQDSLVWSTSIGQLATDAEFESGSIAKGLKEFFGGTVQSFGVPAFTPLTNWVSKEDMNLSTSLKTASIVLATAGPWNESSGFYSRSPFKPGLLPEFDGSVAANIGGVFIDSMGNEVETKIDLVGLNYAALKYAAGHGSVIVVCAGESRRYSLLAALKGSLISVLVTSRPTAEWLMAQSEASDGERPTQPAPPAHHLKRGQETLVGSWTGRVIRIEDDLLTVILTDECDQESLAAFRRDDLPDDDLEVGVDTVLEVTEHRTNGPDGPSLVTRVRIADSERRLQERLAEGTVQDEDYDFADSLLSGYYEQ
jgi:hypothetical protein